MRAKHRADRDRGIMLALLGVLGVIAGAIVVVLLTRGAGGSPVLVAVSPSSPGSSTVAPSLAATVRPSTTTTAGQTLQPPTARPATAAPTPTPEPATPTPAPTSTIPTDESLDASIARCPTAAEIALVDSRITLTFVDDVTAPRLVCRTADGSADLTRLQERAYQAVLVMRRIPFDEPLPWTERTMFNWFTRAVGGIRFEDVENSFCCVGDRVIVIRDDPTMLHLLDYHWAARDEPHWFGLMALPGLLAHEARHAEGYPHTCGSNDETFDEMGAWAVHMLWFTWLAEHATSEYMTPVAAPASLYVDVAAESADDYHDRFCTPFNP